MYFIGIYVIYWYDISYYLTHFFLLYCIIQGASTKQGVLSKGGIHYKGRKVWLRKSI